MGKDEIWMKNLREVEEYIKENKKLPSSSDKNITIKFEEWLSNQRKCYDML